MESKMPEVPWMNISECKGSSDAYVMLKGIDLAHDQKPPTTGEDFNLTLNVYFKQDLFVSKAIMTVKWNRVSQG